MEEKSVGVYYFFLVNIYVTDWKAQTLAHWEQIDRAAVRRFGKNTFAEEAALAVMERLKADDWKSVRSFSGKSTFSTYLRVLTGRMLEDFARSRFGRVRPPSWVKVLGGVWSKLFSALCLERLQVAEAVEVVYQRQKASSKDEIEDAAYSLLSRIPGCGREQGLEVTYDENFPAASSGKSGIESGLEEKELREVLAVILDLEGEEGVVLPGERFAGLKKVRIDLQPEEKLILRLCFQDDLSVVAAGRMIGLNRNQAHGKMRRLLARIRRAFEQSGLDRELQLYFAD
jgi:RNA polymerase sigma factor (sigma-70 family)